MICGLSVILLEQGMGALKADGLTPYLLQNGSFQLFCHLYKRKKTGKCFWLLGTICHPFSPTKVSKLAETTLNSGACRLTQPLCQPLDVALYVLMKRCWKQVLVDYKSQNVSRNVTVAKSDFPQLLSNLIEKMKPTMTKSTINGFKKNWNLSLG